jgi:8-oxo-dGTP pyrophosphatase MutT (NUDIX family)
VANNSLEQLRSVLYNRSVHTVDYPEMRASAVLLLLYPKDGEYCILFNKRTEEVEFNKGDICFPGGSRDPEDASLADTAIRETHEEMGILPQDITILGSLDQTTTRVGFVIQPFVGTIPYPYDFQPSPIEVAEVLEAPISTFFDAHNIHEEALIQRNGDLVRSRSYGYSNHLIYGATARILSQFLEILESSDWLKRSTTP